MFIYFYLQKLGGNCLVRIILVKSRVKVSEASANLLQYGCAFPLFYMQELTGLLTSYFNARSAILRALNEKSPSSLELRETLRLSGEAINRRRKNPDYWLANELYELAKMLHLRLNPVVYVQAITTNLQAIEEAKQQRLLKEAHITPSRIRTIYKNVNCWRNSELIQLSQLLNRFSEKE